MKTGWKWSFVAHAALLLTIALEVFVLITPSKYFLPALQSQHHHLGIPMFAYLEVLASLLDRFLYDFIWIPCVVLVLAGWGVFEWKYRSENKPIVRLTGLSLVSLAMFLIMAFIWVSVTIDLALLPGQIYDSQINLTPQQAERIILPKISKAHATFKELGEAIAREDWPAVGLSAKLFSDTCESLHDTSVSLLLLAGENQRNNLRDIRDLLDEMEKASDKIHSRYRVSEYSKNNSKEDLKHKTLMYFEQLERCYAELRTKSDLFTLLD